MNFGGFVPLRRGILEHTRDGSLTLQEFAALTVLIMNADKSTGSGKINGPVLRSYLPGLSGDAAKRVLCSLEEKGFIFRKITTRSPLVYPYWINKYQPTTGPYKLLQLSIEQALPTHDVSGIRYVKAAPDSAPDTSPEGAPDTSPEGAHYNNKDKDKKLKKEKPPDPNACDEKSDFCVSANVTNKVSACDAACDFRVTENVSGNVTPGDPVSCRLPPGYEQRADGRVYSASGTPLAQSVVAAMLRQEAM